MGDESKDESKGYVPVSPEGIPVTVASAGDLAQKNQRWFQWRLAWEHLVVHTTVDTSRCYPVEQKLLEAPIDMWVYGMRGAVMNEVQIIGKHGVQCKAMSRNYRQRIFTHMFLDKHGVPVFPLYGVLCAKDLKHWRINGATHATFVGGVRESISLRGKIQRLRHTDDKEAERLANDIVDEIHTIHDKGIIHGALVPGNIRFTPEGVMYVTNFQRTIPRTRTIDHLFVKDYAQLVNALAIEGTDAEQRFSTFLDGAIRKGFDAHHVAVYEVACAYYRDLHSGKSADTILDAAASSTVDPDLVLCACVDCLGVMGWEGLDAMFLLSSTATATRYPTKTERPAGEVVLVARVENLDKTVLEGRMRHVYRQWYALVERCLFVDATSGATAWREGCTSILAEAYVYEDHHDTIRGERRYIPSSTPRDIRDHTLEIHNFVKQPGKSYDAIGGGGVIFSPKTGALGEKKILFKQLRFRRDDTNPTARNTTAFRQEFILHSLAESAGIRGPLLHAYAKRSYPEDPQQYGPVIIMERLQGRTVFHYVFDILFKMKTATQPDLAAQDNAIRTLAASLVRTLQHIHDRGFIHGDPHLGNLWVEIDGSIRVLDFGYTIPIGARGSSSTWRADTMLFRMYDLGYLVGSCESCYSDSPRMQDLIEQMTSVIVEQLCSTEIALFEIAIDYAKSVWDESGGRPRSSARNTTYDQWFARIQAGFRLGVLRSIGLLTDCIEPTNRNFVLVHKPLSNEGYARQYAAIYDQIKKEFAPVMKKSNSLFTGEQRQARAVHRDVAEGFPPRARTFSPRPHPSQSIWVQYAENNSS